MKTYMQQPEYQYIHFFGQPCIILSMLSLGISKASWSVKPHFTILVTQNPDRKRESSQRVQQPHLCQVRIRLFRVNSAIVRNVLERIIHESTLAAVVTPDQ